MGHIGDNHTQQVIHLACQCRALDDFRPGLHACAEQVHWIALVALRVLFEPDIQVSGQPQADHFRANQRDIAIYHAGFFQAFDTPKNGTWR